MSRTRRSFASIAVVLGLLTAASCACGPTPPPRPAGPTGGPTPTASTSAQVLFLHNE